jgi:hypothetical protein
VCLPKGAAGCLNAGNSEDVFNRFQ